MTVAQRAADTYRRKKPATGFVFQGDDGGWRWRMESGNHRKIATSGESFSSYSAASEALDLVLSVYIVRVGPKAKAKEQPS